MRVQAGLWPEDWRHWGEQTTFKSNAAALLRKALRPNQAIYCSPLTDPYQPAEAERGLMPEILRAAAEVPSAVFVIQTRGPLILRDLELLRRVPGLRVSFSVTTDREDVRRVFEPHCATLAERWRTIEQLRAAGIATSATLAPVLPCDPEALVRRAIDSTEGPIVADPLHIRATKRSGATTRHAAIAICERHGWMEWLEPGFQDRVLATMGQVAKEAGRCFGTGPTGFGMLARRGP